MRTCIVSLLVATAACTVAPEPPPTPQAVVQLSQSYDRPTGSLDLDVVRDIFQRPLPQFTALKALAGLSFLRDVIADGTTPYVDDPELAINVQGSLAVHAPCPGLERTTPSDETKTGFIDLIIGVDESRVQRAFTGRATDCRFSVARGSDRADVTASMVLELDLGRSIGLGEPVPSLLVRLSELSTELSGPRVGLDIDAVGDSLSLRIGGDDLIETLIDLEKLNVGGGTILLGLRDDGSVVIRGRDNTWVCSSTRSDPCVRTD